MPEQPMNAPGALPRRIVIPLSSPRTGADLVRIGSHLLAPGGVLTALSIVELAEGTPLSEGATRARQARRLLQRVLEFAPPGVDLRTVVRIGARAAEAIVELATEEQAELVLFGWGGRPGRRRGGRARVPRVTAEEAVFSPTIDQVVRAAPCDIAVVKQRGLQDLRRVLVPVRGGPHAELALRFADALGQGLGADVDVMHVVPPDLDPGIRSQAERALSMFVRHHGGARSSPLIVDGAEVAPTILDQSEAADLVVMGATASAGLGGLDAPLFGELPELVAQQARPTVMVVRTREVPTRSLFDQRAGQAETLEAAERAAQAVRSLPARVDRWFAESSFHHGEFADLGRLVELKEQAGADDLGRPAHSRRGRDHRAHRAGGADRAHGEGAAARRAAGHRLRLDRRHPRHRRRRGGAGGPPPVRAAALRQLSGQGRSPLEEPA